MTTDKEGDTAGTNPHNSSLDPCMTQAATCGFGAADANAPHTLPHATRPPPHAPQACVAVHPRTFPPAHPPSPNVSTTAHPCPKATAMRPWPPTAAYLP